MRLVVASDSRELRRSLGPAAWMVLVELICEADDGEPHLGVRTSVRRLATDLSMNKDAVARALARLIECGLVRRGFASRAPGGAFGRGTYALDRRRLDVLLPSTLSTLSTAPPRARGRPRVSPSADQGALFEVTRSKR